MHKTTPLVWVHGILVLSYQYIPDLGSQHSGRTQLGININSTYPVHVLTPLQPSIFALLN